MKPTRNYNFTVSESATYAGGWGVYGENALGAKTEVATSGYIEEAQKIQAGLRLQMALHFSPTVTLLAKGLQEYLTNNPGIHFPADVVAMSMPVIIDVSLEVERLREAKSLKWDQTLDRNEASKVAARVIADSLPQLLKPKPASEKEIAALVVAWASVDPDRAFEGVEPGLVQRAKNGMMPYQAAALAQNFFNKVREEADVKYPDHEGVLTNEVIVLATFFQEVPMVDWIDDVKLQEAAENFVAATAKSHDLAEQPALTM